MNEEATARENLQSAIHREAGMVRIDALVAYLEEMREFSRRAVLAKGVEERSADWSRGSHTALGRLLSILTDNPDQPENP